MQKHPVMIQCPPPSNSAVMTVNTAACMDDRQYIENAMPTIVMNTE